VRTSKRTLLEEIGRQMVISFRNAVLALLCSGAALATAVFVWGTVVVRSAPPPAITEDADPKTAASIPPVPRRQAPALFSQTISREGISVEFSIHKLDAVSDQAEEMHEGDDVRIQFKIADTATGSPVRGSKAMAWMDFIPKSDSRGGRTCEQKAKAFLEGNIFSRPEVDLNVFNVLTLNKEANISVVAPLFGFGGTKLLNMVLLDCPGQDWVISSDETRVYVSLPEAKKVAVIDTTRWEVLRNIEFGRRPGRLALQPDESRLWVAEEAGDAEKEESTGITLLSTSSMEVAARITTGRGPHEMAFSDDGRRAFITNEHDGTLSFIDTRTLNKLETVAYSPLAKMAYVALSGDGAVLVIDGARGRVVARIKSEPGLGQIRFAPGGRLGFFVNPQRDLVHILDAATNRVVQTADVDREPYQISFTSEFAYVRHRGSENVLMLPLKAVGVEKQRVQVFSFPGGNIPPGKAAGLSPADAIVAAPGESAVLVANPMDKSVYFYKEGMAAPTGSFSNYGRQPRALLVVDRTLRERGTPGVYETVARMRRPGNYDVVFLLDSPRAVHCFSACVKPNQELEEKRHAGKINVESFVKGMRVPVGESCRLRFLLTDQQNGVPITGLTDVEVLTNLMPGTWHKRHEATSQGNGVYLLDFTPPRPGLYYVYLQCLSRGLGFNNDQYMVLETVKKDEGHEKPR
jgi:DNA-binding beta-propeller fold protein YncE